MTAENRRPSRGAACRRAGTSASHRHQQDTHQLVTLLKRTRKPMPSRASRATCSSWNRRSSGAASNSARRRKSFAARTEAKARARDKAAAVPAREEQDRSGTEGGRRPRCQRARSGSSTPARPRRPVRKPWPSAALGKASCKSRVTANGRSRLGSHAGTGAAGRRAGGQRRQAAPRAASGGCRGAPFGYLALRWWRKR